MANCIIVFTGYFLAASMQHAYVGMMVAMMALFVSYVAGV